MLQSITDSELDLSAAVDVYGEWVDAAGSYFPNPKRYVPINSCLFLPIYRGRRKGKQRTCWLRGHRQADAYE